MAEQEGELGLVAPGSVTDNLTAEERLAGQACRLGQQHSSAAIAPFGDVEHVYWDDGSAPARRARCHVPHHGGQRSRTAAPGRRLLRRARRPRARGRRSRLMTVSISPGVFVMSLVTAEGGGSHSG
jgi:hypothetical protein